MKHPAKILEIQIAEKFNGVSFNPVAKAGGACSSDLFGYVLVAVGKNPVLEVSKKVWRRRKMPNSPIEDMGDAVIQIIYLFLEVLSLLL